MGDGIPNNSKCDCWEIMTIQDYTVKCSAQLPPTPLTRQEHRPVPPNANPALVMAMSTPPTLLAAGYGTPYCLSTKVVQGTVFSASSDTRAAGDAALVCSAAFYCCRQARA